MELANGRTAGRGPIKSALRYIVLTVRALLIFPIGAVAYALTGRTGDRTYQSFVWLFCVSSGRFNEWMSRLIRPWRPKISIAEPVGVLGDLRGTSCDRLVEQLRRDGYVAFPRAVPDAVVDRLYRFALTTPAVVRRMSHEANRGVTQTALFDIEHPLAVRYDYSPADLLAQADVQAMLADPSILHLMQQYLDSRPSADVLSMWWHTAFQSGPDSEAGQYFHFDMDRFRWLKVFIYLTDVGPENGPHSFVRGSHRPGAIPSTLLNRGYVRLSDQDVAAHFPKQDVIAVTASRGSIIVEDTRGLHKGVHVTGGPRLILQLQFSNSLFGTNYPPARIRAVADDGLRRMLQLAPSIYRQYL